MTDSTPGSPPPPDPTTAWNAEPPEPPDGPDGSTSADGSRRGLLIGAGILAVVVAAVAAFLLLGDDDDDETVQARLAAQFESASNGALSGDDAECLADHVVDEVGEDELADVDFSADEQPAELGAELGTAMMGALETCDLDLSDFGVGGSEPEGDGDDPQDTDSTDSTDDTGTGSADVDSDAMRDTMADAFEESMGLDRDQAECLAGKMAEVADPGELSEQEAMSEVFSYLEDCDIPLDQLGTPSG